MRSKFLVLFITIFSLGASAQKFTTTPYSSYGIGVFGGLDHPNFSGLANISSPVIDSNVLNIYNPASYSLLGKGQPLFSTGISGQFSDYTENGSSYSNRNTGINHFAMGIPVGKRLGWAFGLKPFTRTGYEITDYDAVGTDTIKYSYLGKGSTNELFTGYSFKLIANQKHTLALGSHLSYIFGTSDHQQRSNPVLSTAGGVQELKYQLKSLHYDFGLNYQLMLPQNRKISLGATFTPKQDLIASRTASLYTASFVEVETTYQALSSEKNHASITMPTEFSVGLAYQHRPKVDASFNRTRIYQLSFFAEYKASKWSEYKHNFDAGLLLNAPGPVFTDGHRISLAAEFAPHFNYMDRTAAIGYFYRMRYRVGYQYVTLPYRNGTEQITDSGVTLGFNFPIISQRSLSSLSLGIVAGNRGDGNGGSLNEKYIGINFGVTLAPGAYDKWFRKYKID